MKNSARSLSIAREDLWELIRRTSAAVPGTLLLTTGMRFIARQTCDEDVVRLTLH